MKILCDILYQACKWIITALGLGMLIVVFVGIISRYFFKRPIIWEYEACIAGFIWCTFLGAATCFRDKQHIAFGMLSDALPAMPRKVIMVLKNLLILGILAVGTYYGWQVVLFTMRAKYQTLPFTQAVGYAALPAGFAVSLLFVIEDMYNSVRQALSANGVSAE